MGSKPIVKVSALAMGVGALLATTAVAATAGAASAGAEVQSGSGSAAKDKSRRVCRNLTPSGSRLTRRQCRTQAEWDQSRETTQDGVLKTQLGSGTTYEQMPLPR